MIRVDGDVRRVNVPAQDHAEVQALVYDIMNDRQRKDLEEFLETDFSFEVPGVARFRVNAFNQHRGLVQSSGRFPPKYCRWKRWVWVRYSGTSRCCPEAWCW